MGTIKDRNDMELTEAEDIKKRWQEYTEDLYKKDGRQILLQKILQADSSPSEPPYEDDKFYKGKNFA